MKLKVKDMDIATGDIRVAILNKEDALLLDLHHMDGIIIKKNSNKTIAILDIAESDNAVKKGKIGLFEETLIDLNAKESDTVKIEAAEKPESIAYIKKKLEGKHLNSKEIL